MRYIFRMNDSFVRSLRSSAGKTTVVRIRDASCKELVHELLDSEKCGKSLSVRKKRPNTLDILFCRRHAVLDRKFRIYVKRFQPKKKTEQTEHRKESGIRIKEKAMEDSMEVQGVRYEVIRLLGHGKGGYSYLARSEEREVVIKKIHHEPCAYYSFGNKIKAEKNDYARLKETGIRMPAMLFVDEEREWIVKEYIEGETIFDLVLKNEVTEDYFRQVRDMAEKCRRKGLNIDYFPTNFVVNEGKLYYVDYECNAYSDEWNFENWGCLYWRMSEEMKKYLEEKKNGKF